MSHAPGRPTQPSPLQAGFDPVPVLVAELASRRRASPRSSSCWPRGRRCRSSRATARRRPGARRGADPRDRGAARVPGRARGAPRERARGDRQAGQAHARARERRSALPRPRPSSRISTCPFKPKRRTRAIIAQGARARAARRCASGRSRATATRGARPRRFVDAAKEVPDVAAALAGARDICAERIAEDADVRKLRARGVTSRTA